MDCKWSYFYLNIFCVICTFGFCSCFVTRISIMDNQKNVIFKENNPQFNEEENNKPGRLYFTGSAVNIPCVPVDNFIDSGIITDYKWSLNGKEVNSKRYHVNENGMLSINPLTGKDAGVWRCKVLFQEPKDAMVFNHPTRIKQIMNDKYEVHILYETLSCMFEGRASFGEQILRILKEDTTLKTVSINEPYVGCQVTNKGTFYYKVIVPVIVGGHPTDECGIVCTRERMKNKRETILKQVRNALEKNGRISGFGRDNVHLPIKNSFYSVNTLSCDPGFVRDEEYPNVCRPCSLGSFEKDHVCEKCPIGEYAEFYASTSCSVCPNEKITDFVGSSSVHQCQNFKTETVERVAKYLIPTLFGLFFLGYFLSKCKSQYSPVTDNP